VVRRRFGAAVRCGVIAGGRVGGDSGYLWELQGRMREVRAAPTRKMVADWEGLTVGVGGGGGTATIVVRNASVRAAVAQSPAWTRGGSLGCAWRRVREGKREASTVVSGGFLKWRRRGRGRGSRGGPHVEGRNGEERGGPGHGVG
jgi:hypothetical protein